MRKATLFTVTVSSFRLMLVLLLTSYASMTLRAQVDCPPLTVFCQDLHTSFMADACMVDVWAKDFISKINDNTTSLDSFDISFEEDSIVMSRVFESTSGSTYDEISIWITSRCDPSLKTRCIVRLDINDNTGNCPESPCPADPNPWCGFAVLTCSTVQNTPTENTGHVAAIIDTRKNSQAPRGDNWTRPIDTNEDSTDVIRPDAWTIDKIGNVFGTALNTANGDIYLAASDIYDFDFKQYILLGPPPPSRTGAAGAGGIYRSHFDPPHTTTMFVGTRASYPNPADFNAAVIGSNLIPNTGNVANDNTRSGNGIGNIDYDNRSNHIVASNLEDGKLYSINAASGFITDVYDPFNAYAHSAGLVTPSERIWGVGVSDCGLASRVYFTRNAVNPTTANDVVQRKDVYSIAFNPNGTFAGVERIEFIVEKGDMEKLTDIAFNSDCTQMLVSERGNPHSAEVHRYNYVAPSTWVDDRQFFVGTFDPDNKFDFYPNGIFGNSSAGGVSFGPSENNCTIDATCDDLVWASINCGDIIADDANPPNPSDCAIYGIQGIDAAGNALATLNATDIYVSVDDRDLNNPILFKSNLGDVDIFDCCCPFEPGRHIINAGMSAMIGGEVYTELRSRVQNTQVSVISSSASKEMMTNRTGEYLFEELDMHNNYTITPSKSNDGSDGISTLDLVLIQRHILNTSRLDSPYKIIAADLNGDSKISALDLVTLRKMILGTIDLEQIKSWTFVPSSFKFEDASNPFPYENSITLRDLEDNSMHEDFIAIKRGDVNGDNLINALANNRALKSASIEIEVVNNMAYVSVNKDMNLSGLQFSLSNVGAIVGADWTSGVIEINSNNISASESALNFSWVGNVSANVKAGETLFSFEVAETTSEFSLNHDVLRAEAYDDQLDTYVLGLNSKFQVETALIGNSPNPFNDQTTISFEVSSSQEVSFEFYTIEGKMVHRLSKIFHAGQNSITIDKEDLTQASGNLIVYKMITDDLTSTGKMLMIE